MELLLIKFCSFLIYSHDLVDKKLIMELEQDN